MPLGGLGVLLGGSGGLVAAKFVKCPKSYYMEQFDKYDTTYNTPTPYDPSLVFWDVHNEESQGLVYKQDPKLCAEGAFTKLFA